MKNTQLRLLLSPDCNRNCEKCCNKQFDLNKIPYCKDYTGYENIMLTGGEPMVHPNLIRKAVEEIRKTNKEAKIFLYTAYPIGLEDVLYLLDGVTLTIHEDNDWKLYDKFEENLFMKDIDVDDKSLKLCLFEGVVYHPLNLNWKIRDGIKWLDECPLPPNEDFMRFIG